MTHARVENVYEDSIRAREFLAQSERFFADATKPDLSSDGKSVLFHSAAISACDAVLQSAGLRITVGDGAHLLRLETALEQLDRDHDELLERLDDSRALRNNVSYRAEYVPEASIADAGEATAELIELARSYLGA